MQQCLSEKSRFRTYPYSYGVVTAVSLNCLVLHDVLAYLVDVKMFFVMMSYHFFYALAYNKMTPPVVVSLPQTVFGILLHAVKVWAGSSIITPSVKPQLVCFSPPRPMTDCKTTRIPRASLQVERINERDWLDAPQSRCSPDVGQSPSSEIATLNCGWCIRVACR